MMTRTDAAPALRWRPLALTLLIALVVGAAACGDDDEAVDPAGGGEPTVVFDGAECAYSGTTVFDSGTLPKVTVRNDSDESMELLVLHLEPGVDRAIGVEAANTYARLGDLPEGVSGGNAAGVVSAGSQRQANLSLRAAGEYVVACVGLTFESDDRVAIAAEPSLSAT